MQKFLQVMLLVIAAFFVAIPSAEAATIIEKKGTIFGTPQVQDDKVRVNLTQGSVKFIRHTLYLDSSQTKQAAYSQLRGNSTAFAYRCPGYYLTRVYSDYSGSNLIGTIRIYVAESDLPNATKCADITPPPTPTPPPPPVTVVKKINVSHPNPLAVEFKNTIDVNEDLPIKFDDTVWPAGYIPVGKVEDVEEEDPLPAFTVDHLPEMTNAYPHKDESYDPFTAFSEFDAYFLPVHVGCQPSLESVNLLNPNQGYCFDMNVGGIADGSYTPPTQVNKNLEGDVCVSAGGEIHYYEHYYDDLSNINQDNTLCIGVAEYDQCELVRYFANYRDEWSEDSDQNFENIADDLKQMLNFPPIYCKWMKNYVETNVIYDPVTGDNLARSAYQITDCEGGECDEMIPDPFFTPSTTPVDPGGNNGGTSPPNGNTPRRRYA